MGINESFVAVLLYSIISKVSLRGKITSNYIYFIYIHTHTYTPRNVVYNKIQLQELEFLFFL